MAAAFCPACCATIFSSCRLARWTAPIGMPVSAEIARTLRPAASNGATVARLLSWALRALGAANRRVSAVMAYFTADDARSGTQSPTKRFVVDLDGERRGHDAFLSVRRWRIVALGRNTRFKGVKDEN